MLQQLTFNVNTVIFNIVKKKIFNYSNPAIIPVTTVQLFNYQLTLHITREGWAQQVSKFC